MFESLSFHGSFHPSRSDLSAKPGTSTKSRSKAAPASITTDDRSLKSYKNVFGGPDKIKGLQNERGRYDQNALIKGAQQAREAAAKAEARKSKRGFFSQLKAKIRAKFQENPKLSKDNMKIHNLQELAREQSLHSRVDAWRKDVASPQYSKKEKRSAYVGTHGGPETIRYFSNEWRAEAALIQKNIHPLMRQGSDSHFPSSGNVSARTLFLGHDDLLDPYAYEVASRRPQNEQNLANLDFSNGLLLRDIGYNVDRNPNISYENRQAIHEHVQNLTDGTFF